MPLPKKIFIAAISGFIIGAFAGLIGVGGGEFRLPLLVGIFDLPIYFATTTNLVIGIMVSLVSFSRRISLMTPYAYNIVVIMGLTSIVGGYLGAHITGRIKERIVSYVLLVFLLVIGLKLILSSLITFNLPSFVLGGATKLILLAISGFLLGIISGIFGVAGGEFRIPILMFLFALPIKVAGTVSSLVALFAQGGGLWKHQRLKHISKDGLIIAASMGASSILGSYLGAALVFHVSAKALEFLLGIALILATIGMYRKLKH